MDPAELAIEMAAARKRCAERTARQLQEARVFVIRNGMRPGSTRVEVEERAKSFYPRLNPDLLEQAIAVICGARPEVIVSPEISVPG